MKLITTNLPPCHYGKNLRNLRTNWQNVIVDKMVVKSYFIYII